MTHPTQHGITAALERISESPVADMLAHQNNLAWRLSRPDDLPHFANIREGIEYPRKSRKRRVFFASLFCVAVLVAAHSAWPYPVI